MPASVSCLSFCKATQAPRKGLVTRIDMTTGRYPATAGIVRRHVTTQAAVAEDDMGKIVEPSVFNQFGVRIGSILLAVGAAAAAGKVVPATIAIVLHLMCAGTWCAALPADAFLPSWEYASYRLGVNIWTTFIAGFVMIKSMPRQTFGKVQSKLFPLLFGLTTACSAVVLATLYMGPLADIATPRVQYTAILGLVTSVANLCFIEPAATKVMFERYDLENSTEVNVKSEQRAALTKKFGMLHGLSSMTALGNLLAVLSHFVWLGILVQGSLA